VHGHEDIALVERQHAKVFATEDTEFTEDGTPDRAVLCVLCDLCGEIR